MPNEFFHPMGSASTEARYLMNMRNFTDPALLTLQSKCFMFADVRQGIADDDVYYYSFTIGSKSLILFQSSFTIGEGPVFASTIEAPTSFTPGTEKVIANTYRSKKMIINLE